MSTQHTPRQVGILRHALGLKADGSGRSYRSHFVTGPGSDDFDDCEALVNAGLMSKRKGSPLSGGDPVYLVTGAGAAIAKPAESLSSAQHTPGRQCDECEGFCLVTVANKKESPARPGMFSAICQCCGRQSHPVRPDEQGEPDMWKLPCGWSMAPFPKDCVHADGSVGSTYTCPSCNAQLRKGTTLQLRANAGRMRNAA